MVLQENTEDSRDVQIHQRGNINKNLWKSIPVEEHEAQKKQTTIELLFGHKNIWNSILEGLIELTNSISEPRMQYVQQITEENAMFGELLQTNKQVWALRIRSQHEYVKNTCVQVMKHWAVSISSFQYFTNAPRVWCINICAFTKSNNLRKCNRQRIPHSLPVTKKY